MRQDEEIAERMDADRFAAEEGARVAEVEDAIAQGGEPSGGAPRT
jgi:hypothetical protein